MVYKSIEPIVVSTQPRPIVCIFMFAILFGSMAVYKGDKEEYNIVLIPHSPSDCDPEVVV